MIELLCALATWRITSLLVHEAGPYEIFAKMRAVLGVTYTEYSECRAGPLTSVFCCVFCCSVWVGLFIALALAFFRGDSPLILFINTFAFSTGAILVEEVVHGA